MEKVLMKSKWWDYRLLSPRDSTILFIICFAKRISKYNEHLGNSPHINVLRTIDESNLEGWKQWKIADRLRRWCDERCMKYDDFWNWACEEHERMGYRRTFLNCFSGERILSEIERRFKESEELRLAKSLFFTADSYTGCILQKLYYYDLLMKIKKKYGTRFLEVWNDLIDEGHIPSTFGGSNGGTCGNRRE